jgi:diadenosine tetraphosphate (Ap4A) HIT family hydrolase
MVKRLVLDQQLHQMAVAMQGFIIHGYFNMKYDTLSEAQAAGVAPWDDVVREDFHVVVFRDRYPVTPGHLLFVPVYNSEGVIKDTFGDAVREGERMVAAGECDAFNVGLNMGTAAGQTVMYPHVHLIPRRTGDCADPVGGVRGVIPGQANYKTDTYCNPNK